MAEKGITKRKYVKVEVDPETAFELVLSLADLDTFLDARPCGSHCLAMKFHGGDGPYEKKIKGLPSAIVEEFSQAAHF